jgi:hypothetical protein
MSREPFYVCRCLKHGNIVACSEILHKIFSRISSNSRFQQRLKKNHVQRKEGFSSPSCAFALKNGIHAGLIRRRGSSPGANYVCALRAKLDPQFSFALWLRADFSLWGVGPGLGWLVVTRLWADYGPLAGGGRERWGEYVRKTGFFPGS